MCTKKSFAKNSNSHRHEYVWAGDKLIAEKRKKSSCDLQVGGYIYDGGHYIYAEEKFIEYIYGVDGVIGFRLDGIAYWYLKNFVNKFEFGIDFCIKTWYACDEIHKNELLSMI